MDVILMNKNHFSCPSYKMVGKFRLILEIGENVDQLCEKSIFLRNTLLHDYNYPV